MHQQIKLITILFFLFSFYKIIFGQIKSLDEFETTDGWSFIKADGVNFSISIDKGLHGSAIKFDYDFIKGTGYGGIQKLFPIDLPENYQFTFYIKTESPANNFEIKFIDSTGQTVWWVNNRNYDFPKEWKKIRIKKRHINFAWGPTDDQDLKRIDRIEFTIASFVGGKGTVWIDDLKFEPLPPETNICPQPLITATSLSFNHTPAMMIDGSNETYWESVGLKDQSITIDFKTRREFGGLKIDWLDNHYPESFEILFSDDGSNWEKVYLVSSNRSNVSFIKLTEAETRFIRINLFKQKSDATIGIREIKFLDVNNSLTLNDFLIYTAKNSSKGFYPRYFLEEASYWNVLGVNNDVKEALINEDGMVEIEKGKFSIEPMLKVTDSLFNWSNVTAAQSLEENYLPIPKVIWNCNSVNLEIKTFADGQANKNSTLYLKYTITNNTSETKKGSLFLLIRPFQVNPYYQFLNLTGGAGKINSIKEENHKIILNDEKVILPITRYSNFGAITFDEGNIVDLIEQNRIPKNNLAVDKTNLASGVLQYDFELKPGEEKNIYLAVPFYKEDPIDKNLNAEIIEKKFIETKEFWISKVDHIKFNLPKSADKIVNTYKSNLAYILINKDNAGIQPGSRSYERSWIRDGALTSSALLKSGIVTEVKDFINWYTDHQYENGKVPCVVDLRGPDPVPENDSHGEMIYLIHEYFNFTKDTTFLRSKNKNVLKAV
ncbi:MAG: discoidin domain-containing protein, partial [Ignavibacteriota bacterium]